MHSLTADDQARLLGWRRVRDFAVPVSMIEVATARRVTGDWAGACAAAHVDVDLDLRTVVAAHGRELATLVRADLRRLAPDLLRWHLPRAVSGGRLRPALTISLARYPGPVHDVHLVVRTAPRWADAGQRLSLALWDTAAADPGPHPRPRPDRRFRLDLHQHLWAADRAADLRERCGADEWAASTGPSCPGGRPGMTEPAWMAQMPPDRGYAAHRWAAEAAILRAADGHPGPVTVRLGGRRRLLVYAQGSGGPSTAGGGAHAGTAVAGRAGFAAAGGVSTDQACGCGAGAGGAGFAAAGGVSTDQACGCGAGADGAGFAAGATDEACGCGAGGDRFGVRWAGVRGSTAAAVLPYAATWLPPDLELLHAGLISAGMLHPLVAEALAPTAGPGPGAADPAPGGPRLVDCRGATHRLGLVDGVLVPLDHDPEELRREELLVSLGGPPLPCLRAIAATAGDPGHLDEVRGRLAHGDHAGAWALVAELLGPRARPEGTLREAFTEAENGRIVHGLYRAGLAARARTRLAAATMSRPDRAGRRGRRHRLTDRVASTG